MRIRRRAESIAQINEARLAEVRAFARRKAETDAAAKTAADEAALTAAAAKLTADAAKAELEDKVSEQNRSYYLSHCYT